MIDADEVAWFVYAGELHVAGAESGSDVYAWLDEGAWAPGYEFVGRQAVSYAPDARRRRNRAPLSLRTVYMPDGTELTAAAVELTAFMHDMDYDVEMTT